MPAVFAEQPAVKSAFPGAKGQTTIKAPPNPTLAHVEQVWFTEDDYLAREELAPYKNEFHPTGQVMQNDRLVVVGKIVAMAGARPDHNTIAGNIFGELHSVLKGKSCRPFGSDQAIKIPATGRRVYPDLSVICGPMESEDSPALAATNPTLLAEVLSPGTEQYDRGAKFLNYKQLDSLKEYLLVSTSEALIERFHRQENGVWTHESVAGLGQSLPLQSIGITLNLADVYAGVGFEFEDE